MIHRIVQTVFITATLVAPAVASAGPRRAPTGRQIALAAQRARFLRGRAFSPRAGVRVIPAQRSGRRPTAGGIVARVVSNNNGSRAFSVGRHHVFVSRLNGKWRTFVERGGRITAEQATRVVRSTNTAGLRTGMCFGWYECHNGKCVCYGIVIKGTPF